MDALSLYPYISSPPILPDPSALRRTCFPSPSSGGWTSRADSGARTRRAAFRFPPTPHRPPPRPAASPFDLSPPPIDLDTEDMMVAGTNTSANGSVDDNQALEAALNGIAVADLSHFGRIRVTGEDRAQFLHNQTTAKFDSLLNGEGCDTVFVSPTARTIDFCHAWVMVKFFPTFLCLTINCILVSENRTTEVSGFFNFSCFQKHAIMLLVSPCTRQSIAEMLNKYIFYADKVEVQDMTEQTCFFVLLGPKSNQAMKTLKLDDLIGQPYGTHRHYNVNGMPVTVGVGSVMYRDGFSFLLSPDSADLIWNTLLKFGALPMGPDAWERLRVIEGRPAPGKELTNDFNVLEAGLQRAVSLDKGCYKGQETISRLITYNGVKQRLWGFRLSGPSKPGSPITVDGRKVGVLTSYSLGRRDGEHVGLGYVRRQVGPGAEVLIGDVVGTVVDVPFLYHSLQ